MHGLIADPSRTADFASILRPPGTYNRKNPDAPRLVKVKCWATPISYASFAEKIEVASQKIAEPVRQDIPDNSDLTAHLSRPQTPLSEFARMLPYINPGLPRPDWWGVLIAAGDAYGEDARSLITEWSAGQLHGGNAPANYNAQDVQTQFDDALKRSGTREGNRFTVNGHVRRLAEAGGYTAPIVASSADPVIAELNAEYAIIKANGAVYNRAAGCFMQNSALHTIYANRLVDIGTDKKSQWITASKYWLGHADRATYSHLDLDPNAEEVTRTGGLNTWRGFTGKPQAGNITPWMDLLEWVVPEANKKFVLNWFAGAIQNLAERFHVALAIWSRNQGTGKSLLCESVLRLVHEDHAPVLGQDVFDTSFTDWMRGTVLAIFDEVSASTDRQRADRIKVLLTASRHRINRKYEPVYEEPNRLKAIFLSNHPDAVFLTDTDRRFYVIEANSERPPQTLIDKFIAWRDSGGKAALLHFLQTFDVGDFDPKAPAPMTAAKREMIEDNRSDLERWVSGLLQNENLSAVLGREVCTAEELTDRYNRAHSGRHVSTKAVTNILRKDGVVRLEKQARKSSGERPRCYALRDAAKYVDMTSTELGAEMDKPFRMS